MSPQKGGTAHGLLHTTVFIPECILFLFSCLPQRYCAGFITWFFSGDFEIGCCGPSDLGPCLLYYGIRIFCCFLSFSFFFLFLSLSLSLSLSQCFFIFQFLPLFVGFLQYDQSFEARQLMDTRLAGRWARRRTVSSLPQVVAPALG